MAEFNGATYTQLYVPPKDIQGVHGTLWGNPFFQRQMLHTQPSAGSANDTILMGKAPPFSAAGVQRFILEFSAWGAGALFDLGWDAYENSKGVVVAANSQGLITGISIATAGTWSGGTEATSRMVSFDAKDEVVLRATIRGAALPQSATLALESVWTC